MKRHRTTRSPRTGHLGHEVSATNTRPVSMMGRKVTATLATVAIGLAIALPGSASAATSATTVPPSTKAASVPATAAPAYVPGVVLVRYAPTTSATTRAAAKQSVSAAAATRISTATTNVEKLQLESGASVEDAVTTLGHQPGVIYAEPDYLVAPTDVANDPYVTDGSLWGMEGDTSNPANQYGSQAAEAWPRGLTGNHDIAVGIVDEGVDFHHPDLAANVWTNPFDPIDGIDNDGNGYVDDVHGWDFFNHNNTVFDGNDTEGLDHHGTHVAGTIAGQGGNGQGVAGVTWNTTLIPAKFLGPGGGSTSDAIAALDYLTDLRIRHGINVVASNNSWGGGGYSQALLDAIERGGRAGILFVAAAGNNGSDTDVNAFYPADYECASGGFDCVISVAAINASGARAGFSNFGSRTVDLGAPGENVVSSVPNGQYEFYSGTSMATPHVTGAIALCASIKPNASPEERKGAVLRSAVPTSSLAGVTTTGGRLDVNAMTSLCQPATSPVTGSPQRLATRAVTPNRVQLTWEDHSSNEDQFGIDIARSTGGQCGSFTNARFAAADTTSVALDGLSGGTPYCFRVRAENSFSGGTVTAWSNVASTTTGRTYECVTTPYRWIDPTAGGTNHRVYDDGDVAVTMPFGTPLYGNTISTLNVSANGFVRFDGGSATTFANSPIPTVGDPEAILAPFWDDLNPEQGGGVWTNTVGTAPNRRFVVGWIAVPHFGGAGDVSIELIIDETTGAVTYQYQDVDLGDPAIDGGASATVGMEDPNGSIGTQVSYNTASLSNASAYRCSTGSADRAALSIGDAGIPEGDRGSRTVRIPVTLSAPATGPVTASYRTIDGSATAGRDFTESHGTVTIPTGSTSSYVAVVVAGDRTREAHETLAVELTAPTGATLGRAMGTITIRNDDASTGLRLGVGPSTVVEGTSGRRALRFAVSLSATSGQPVSVRYATVDGTAHSGRDYQARSGTLSIPAGATTRSITVWVDGGTTREAEETFEMVLSSARGARLAPARGEGRILNDD